jgi:predicted small lipoprotein YifL
MNTPTDRFRHPLRIAAAIAALLGVASCGQKGPLYLPDPAPQSVPAAADQKTDTDTGPAKRRQATPVPPEGSGPGPLP